MCSCQVPAYGAKFQVSKVTRSRETTDWVCCVTNKGLKEKHESVLDTVKQTKFSLQKCSRKLKNDEWFFPSITKRVPETLFNNVDSVQLLQY